MNEERGKIMGINCLEEVLKAYPRRIIKVMVALQKNRDRRKEALISKIKEAKLPIQEISFDHLTALIGSDSHQGFVAEVKRYFLDLPSFLEESQKREKMLVLLLDSIFDPHNVGAILRAAECFGVDAVIFSKNRGSDITSVVSKVSSGASELVNLIKVSNLAESVRRFKEEGFSTIIADGSHEATPIFNFNFPEKTVLILGSEGEGVQPLLRKLADLFVKIPQKGKIDSLNVSQAASIFLYKYASQ